MSENLRWKIVVGCLLLVILEAPDSSLVFAQDLAGPWRARASTVPVAALEAPTAVVPSTAVVSSIRAAAAPRAAAADASLAVEDLLDLDRDPPSGPTARYPEILAAR